MSGTDGGDDLARRKAEAEIAKLEAEAAKAKREGRGIGAPIGVVVSVATVLTSLIIGGSQVWIAYQRGESERRLSEIDLGLKTTDFVLTRRDRFLAAPPEGQVAFVSLVVTIFPPDDARRLLMQLAQDLATQAASIATICSALGSLGPQGALSAERLGCTGDPAPPAPRAVASAPAPSADPAESEQVRTAEAARQAVQAVERRAVAQRTAADPCAGLPEPTETELRVFPHVLDRVDRTMVLESAALRAAIGWPLAPVQFVDLTWTRQEGEVRYYFPDQCRLAVDLAERFGNGLRAAGIDPPPFTPRYIGISYRNLPRGRIEVWIPPLGR